MTDYGTVLPLEPQFIIFRLKAISECFMLPIKIVIFHVSTVLKMCVTRTHSSGRQNVVASFKLKIVALRVKQGKNVHFHNKF